MATATPLIAGEHRLEAARLLNWSTIDAMVHTTHKADAYVLELVENLQREELSAEEEYEAYVELMRLNGWGIRELAAAVGRSPSYVSRRTRIFQDVELCDAVLRRGMPISTAEELVAVADALRSTLIREALAQGWTGYKAREAVRALRDEREAPGLATREEGLLAGPSTDEEEEMDGVSDLVLRAATPPLAPGRPPGLDRAAKELLDMLLDVQVDDLTDRDKRLLKRIWDAIRILAQATPGNPKVFPPLPAGSTRSA